MAITPPRPYATAMASDASRPSDDMNTREYIACVTPMSRTRPALSENESDSCSGRPKSLTSNAPETLNRSVIICPISPFSSYRSRVMPASLRPTNLAGSTNSGSSTSDRSVICHESTNIAIEGRGDADDVADHVRQGRGERLLRALDIAVQAGHQCAGARSCEEADRHRLDVVEHLGSQVEDEALADPCREPALHDTDDRRRQRQQRDQHGHARPRIPSGP